MFYLVNSVGVIIPVYKNYLNEFEKISLNQLFKILGKYTKIFVAPKSLKLNNYKIDSETFQVERFDDCYFKNIDSYNKLMLSEDFYMRFTQYKKILIYQLDAFVFSDKLLEFCDMNYDYIGAPWINGMPYYKYNFRGAYRLNKIFRFFNKPQVCYVGNGGFSLRNVKSTINLLRENKQQLASWSGSEDIFFSLCGLNKKFKVASTSVALEFSFELSPKDCFELNGYKLPFGCHAWEKYNIEFFRPFFCDLGYKI